MNPCEQLHANEPGVFTQIPLCSHGEPAAKNRQKGSVLALKPLPFDTRLVTLTLIALVNVFRAVDALVPDGARARERAVDRAGVADRVRVARVRRARIVQMAQQPRLAGRAAAVEAADTVDTGRPIEAGRVHTIVNVVAAVGPVPAVHADAVVAAVRVGAGRPVLADRWPQRTLVHVVLAELAGKAGRATAVVGVDAVHACPTVLAQVARAVVRVFLAVLALKTWCRRKNRERVCVWAIN